MYVSGRLLAVDQRYDMGMMEALQDVDLGIEVLLQLLVELVHVDGFDCHIARAFLQMEAESASGYILNRGSFWQASHHPSAWNGIA